MRLCWLMLTAAAASAFAQAPDPTLAATPPMGWNSWNHFAGRVTDADVRAAADAMAANGMRDAGYRYVNIDDTWQGTRDRRGFIHSNERFPDMKALADYVHAKGLKIGIYSSPGPFTCAHYAGSWKHERRDAETYAAWGVDYLKYDMCSYGNRIDKKYGKPSTTNAPERLAADKAAYDKMHRALLATGRPIVFSLCQYGWDDVWRWGATVGGNTWRTTGDIEDNWRRMSLIGFGQAGLAKYASPGHWNDPDMLEVGNGGMTDEEYRTHMSLWALLAAPLLAGNDLSRMGPADLAILTNKDVIAVDQDPLGKGADRVSQEGPVEVWARPLAGGAVAVGLFNRAETPHPVTVALAQAGARPDARVRDLWAGMPVQVSGGKYAAMVPPHGVVLLRMENPSGSAGE